MAEEKKQQPTQQPFRESVDFGEASRTRTIDNNNTVSQRVPITPAPPRPPERDKK